MNITHNHQDINKPHTSLGQKFLNRFLLNNQNKNFTPEELARISTILYKLTSSYTQIKYKEFEERELHLKEEIHKIKHNQFCKNPNPTPLHSTTPPPPCPKNKSNIPNPKNPLLPDHPHLSYTPPPPTPNNISNTPNSKNSLLPDHPPISTTPPPPCPNIPNSKNSLLPDYSPISNTPPPPTNSLSRNTFLLQEAPPELEDEPDPPTDLNTLSPAQKSFFPESFFDNPDNAHPPPSSENTFYFESIPRPKRESWYFRSPFNYHDGPDYGSIFPF